MANNVTLKDVARRAGVSYQTVSKVLRNQIQVTPEVRARVQQAVEELGYRPKITALSLRLQTSHLICYSWIRERLSPHPGRIEQSIVNAAERLGYHILLFPYHQGQTCTAPENSFTGARDFHPSVWNSTTRASVLEIRCRWWPLARTAALTFPGVDVDGGLASVKR